MGKLATAGVDFGVFTNARVEKIRWHPLYDALEVTLSEEFEHVVLVLLFLLCFFLVVVVVVVAVVVLAVIVVRVLLELSTMIPPNKCM